MVICLERGADLHMAQLMPLPLTVSCLSKIQVGFTFLVPAHPGSHGQRAVKRVCVCVCVLFPFCKEVGQWPIQLWVDSRYPLYFSIKSRILSGPHRISSPWAALHCGALQSID